LDTYLPTDELTYPATGGYTPNFRYPICAPDPVGLLPGASFNVAFPPQLHPTNDLLPKYLRRKRPLFACSRRR